MTFKLKLEPITCNIDYQNETVTLSEVIAGQLHKQVLDTKDRVIREALIKLGWTPPRDENIVKDSDYWLRVGIAP